MPFSFIPPVIILKLGADLSIGLDHN
jgi:hypothetical protein